MRAAASRLVGPVAGAGIFLALLGTVGCAPGGGAGDPADGERFTLTVEAGERDRLSVPVGFELPASVDSTPYRLRDSSGSVVPIQIGPESRAWFILDSLPAGAVREYVLEPGSVEAAPVAMRRGSGTVVIEVDDHPVLTYNAAITDLPRRDVEPVYARGGYIHPIRTPEGVVVTGDYPPDHVHHHGIWAAWTRTRFRGQQVDFWNVADGTGDVLPMGVDSAWSGPVHAGFSSRHRYVALTGGEPVDALHERWTVRVYNVRGDQRPYWLFDLEVEQRTAGADSLVLPEYHYGGVAFRGRDDWYGTPNASFLTSEGLDRDGGNESRARWTHMGGSAEGGLRGVAVLSHPDNFRHPEPVRIHPREPYFVWAPSQLGEWAIAPGEVHRVRYRYVVHDGDPDPEVLDRLWADFASPPSVTVQPR